MGDTVDVFIRTNADQAAQSMDRAARSANKLEREEKDLVRTNNAIQREGRQTIRVSNAKAMAYEREARAAAKARRVQIAKEAFAQAGSFGGPLGGLSPISGAISAGTGVGGGAGIALGVLGASAAAAGVAFGAMSAAADRAAQRIEQMAALSQKYIDAETQVAKERGSRGASASGSIDPLLARLQFRTGKGVSEESLGRDAVGRLGGITSTSDALQAAIGATKLAPSDRSFALQIATTAAGSGEVTGAQAIGMLDQTTLNSIKQQYMQRPPSMLGLSVQEFGAAQILQRQTGMGMGAVTEGIEALRFSGRRGGRQRAREGLASAQFGEGLEYGEFGIRQQLSEMMTPVANKQLEILAQEQQRLEVAREIADAEGIFFKGIKVLGMVAGGEGTAEMRFNELSDRIAEVTSRN